MIASAFFINLFLDLLELVFDMIVVGGDTIETAQRITSFFSATSTVGEARRFWKAQNTYTEDDSPKGRKAIGNAPLCRILVSVVRTPIDLYRY